MDTQRIAFLLRPFFVSSVAGGAPSQALKSSSESALSEAQLQQLLAYLDLLLRWNSRVNLTAVREPEQIITRHFGESLFAGRFFFPAGRDRQQHTRVIDFGSGGGFPGLPIKIWAPEIQLTLIESNQKKATFLREVIRSLALDAASVFAGRAEDFIEEADIVTLRAVEHFEHSLRAAARLIAPEGTLALLIGESQLNCTREFLPSFTWHEAIPIPLSSNRVLLPGTAPAAAQKNQVG